MIGRGAVTGGVSPDIGYDDLSDDAVSDAALGDASLADGGADEGPLNEPAPAPVVADEDVPAALEAVLLVVDSPVTDEALATAVGRSAAEVRAHLLAIAQRLTEARSGIDLREFAGGWRFYTRDVFAPVVERFVMDGTQTRLSRAALETLAVVAYRQPVTRARISAVRGVNVDGVVRTLLARGLIEEEGTDSDTGGTLYRTTEMFLERMGLASLEDLPALGPLLPDVDAIDDE